MSHAPIRRFPSLRRLARRPRTLLTTLTTTLLTLPLAAAGEAEIRAVAPATVQPHLTSFLEPHQVAPPRGSAQGRLFVFLPGSFGRPGNTRAILETAAGLGLHAIGLRYPNAWTVAGLCGRSADPDCHGKARREILFGEPSSPLVEVSPESSIIGRLSALLGHLDGESPDEGWGDYLDAGSPRWSRIAVGGHSQGGGHAAFLGLEHAVERVLLFAAPADVTRAFGPVRTAAWLRADGATEPGSYFAFTHEDDNLPRHLEAWRALGLDAHGAPARVDGSAPPFDGTRQLLTDRAVPAGSNAHGSVVVDRRTPRDPAGAPVFAPVWAWMLTAGSGSGDPSDGVDQPLTGDPLLLEDGRFEVRAAWTTRRGATGPATPVSLSTESGFFWFFEASNLELLVKLIDGCTVNGHRWFFAAGLTDVDVALEVLDRTTGERRTYARPAGLAFEPIQDGTAFDACP